MIGAYSFLLWVQLAGTDQNRLLAFRLIAFLMGIQLVFSLFNWGGSLNWVADISGFVAGFALSFLVAPGGFKRALDWCGGAEQLGQAPPARAPTLADVA